jgi:hypothetical protein
MGSHFGVHSAHRHDHIPVGTVRLEKDMIIDGFSWTRATAIEKLDPAGIHGTAFKLVQNTLVPYEFADGPSPAAGIINNAHEFLTEFATYLADNDLDKVFALEVKNYTKRDAAGPQTTAEIEVHGDGFIPFTVAVPVSAMTPGAGLVQTGWNVRPGAAQHDPDGEPPAGEHWNEVVVGPKKTHKVHVDSTEAVTPEGLHKVFVKQGILKA